MAISSASCFSFAHLGMSSRYITTSFEMFTKHKLESLKQMSNQQAISFKLPLFTIKFQLFGQISIAMFYTICVPLMSALEILL
jgi:hypothetical protein